jgi:FkbM family methyltransferase
MAINEFIDLYLNIKGYRMHDKLYLGLCYLSAGIIYTFKRKKFVTIGQFLKKDIIVRDKNGILYYVRAKSEALGYVVGAAKPETRKWFNPKKGDTVVDVGAAIGKFSLFAGKMGCNVISIEPHPITFDVLKKNIELNSFKNIKAINLAVGREKGKADLYSPKDFFGTASLNKDWENRFDLVKYTVDLVPLDDITKELNNIDWLLIDVEGFEFEVLKGANETLKKTGKIIIEISRKNIDLIPEYLKKYNFEIKDKGIIQEAVQYYFFVKI